MKILIADDHSIVREGLRTALDGLGEDIQLLEAATADEARQQLAAHPDTELVILDLHMPGSNGLDLISDLCNTYTGIPVAVLSAEENPQMIQQTIDRGAAGFIPKSSASRVMVSALQLILSGGVYIPPNMIFDTQLQGGRPARTGASPDLTQRQQDVLVLLASGHSNKSIAKELGLSEHTIKIHITAILRALGVNNRTEAAVACMELGLITEE